MVLYENVQAGNSRSETQSLLRLDPRRNPLLLAGTVIALLVHVVAMYTPGLREVLHLAPVSSRQWLLTMLLTLSLFVTSEAHKAWIRARGAS
jgi:hypothetical protein